MGDKRPPREWVPSCFLLLHDAHVRTTLRYSPMHIQRADVRYLSEIKIYGRSPTQPVWSTGSEPMRIDDVFSVQSTQIAESLGLKQMLAYGEAYNHTPDMAPPTANVAMPVHMHFTSDDGSMFGHLASFYIFGSPRSVLRGNHYYDTFPGARVDADHQISVFVMNPFVRPSRFWVSVVWGDGTKWTSPELKVRGKGAAEWRSSESDCPHSAEPAGIIIESELKTSAVFATRAGDGKMLGFDHGHPFLAQVLDHQ